MINFDDVTKENIKEHNPNWLQIPDNPYRILIMGGSGSGKRNTLLNLISHHLDIDKVYLFTKDPFEPKHQILMNKQESVGSNYCNDLKAVIEYPNDMGENVDEYNLNKKCKRSIVLDECLAIKNFNG